MSRLFRRPLFLCALTYFVLWLALVACNYPYTTDAVQPKHSPRGADAPVKVHWDQVFDEDTPAALTPQAAEAHNASNAHHIREHVSAFVRMYGLEHMRVLEVGAGRGYLQDVVADYTGLDVSSRVARYFHKPFHVGSATALPFLDSEFDVIWTVWVLEHVPNPEWALNEMRRVVKPGGLIYLRPAWHCNSWAATGIGVRPFSHLSWTQWPAKASLILRGSENYQWFCRTSVRSVRLLQGKLSSGPTRFHYRALAPNYEHYWTADADAINSLDAFETFLWFTSRSDECLNCGTAREELLIFDRSPLIIRVRKS